MKVQIYTKKLTWFRYCQVLLEIIIFATLEINKLDGKTRLLKCFNLCETKKSHPTTNIKATNATTKSLTKKTGLAVIF